MHQDIPVPCDGCGEKFSIEHALSFPNGGFVMSRHDDAAKEWGALRAWALIPSSITYKPKINIRTVQGETTGDEARQEIGTADGGTETVGEAQGGRVRTVNGSARLSGQLVQVLVPADLGAGVSAHGFWKRGTTAMFDIEIVNLDAGSYLRMTLEKAVVKAKKELYLQACLERRSTFTPMVYSADGIPGAEALSAQKRLAVLLSYKLKREYSEMCSFVRATMSLAILRSYSLLLRDPRNKGARIWQQPELADRVVMALLLLWRG